MACSGADILPPGPSSTQEIDSSPKECMRLVGLNVNRSESCNSKPSKGRHSPFDKVNKTAATSTTRTSTHSPNFATSQLPQDFSPFLTASSSGGFSSGDRGIDGLKKLKRDLIGRRLVYGGSWWREDQDTHHTKQTLFPYLLSFNFVRTYLRIRYSFVRTTITACYSYSQSPWSTTASPPTLLR